MPFPVTPGFCFSENLLKNGNATQDLLHWVTYNGGDGWNTAYDVNRNDPRKMFVTGSDWVDKFQNVDISSFVTVEMENPEIAFTESYRQTGALPDQYRVSTFLYDQREDLIVSNEATIRNVSNEQWNHVNFYFEQYGPGIRIVRVQHGGQDGEHFAGFNGVAITDSQLMVRTACRPFLVPYTVTLTTRSYFSSDCTGNLEKTTEHFYEMENCQETHYGHCVSVDPPTIQLWFYEHCEGCACVPSTVQVHKGQDYCIAHPTKPQHSLRYSWESDGYCTEASGPPPAIPSPTASPPSVSPTYSYYWVSWRLMSKGSVCYLGDSDIGDGYESVTVCARDVLMFPNLCHTGTLMFSRLTNECKCCTHKDPQWRHEGFDASWSVFKMEGPDELFFNPNDTMNEYNIVLSRKCRPDSLLRGTDPMFDTSECEFGYSVSHEKFGTLDEPVAHVDGCDVINMTLFSCDETYEVSSVAPQLAISIVSVGVILGLVCMICYWGGGQLQQFVEDRLFGPRRRRNMVDPKSMKVVE